MGQRERRRKEEREREEEEREGRREGGRMSEFQDMGVIPTLGK